jgi:hypothetical protein
MIPRDQKWSKKGDISMTPRDQKWSEMLDAIDHYDTTVDEIEDKVEGLRQSLKEMIEIAVRFEKMELAVYGVSSVSCKIQQVRKLAWPEGDQNEGNGG